MLCKIVLLAGVLAMVDGAALVRFINTVPTRTARASVDIAYTAPTTAASSRLIGHMAAGAAGVYHSESRIDRVGLYYYSSVEGTTTTPTIVWTQILEAGDYDATSTNAIAWEHGMPPLRGYHAPATGAVNAAAEAAAVDTPLHNYLAASNAAIAVDRWDVYDQTRLKADGVGLYLSFAPGSYSVQAYAVMNDVTVITGIFANAPRVFPTSSTTLTFQDNKVYTLIAYGTGAYSATVPYTGANVRLALIEESIAPTVFGRAALRWFHAIQTENANTLDVYRGNTFGESNRVGSNIAFGTVSQYVDVAPSTIAEYGVGTGRGSVRPVGSGITVQHDIRAGMRATIICATTDEQLSTVFCRAIPSRAVAYVRLINDCAGQTSIVQGRFGPQALSDTKLSLWASYEVPRPEQVYEQSQVVGNSVWTNHPATTEGLYPVVKDVSAGAVSGYGEVFVPLFIMDYAVRFVVQGDNVETLYTEAANTRSAVDYTTALQRQFWFAPILKRVHFLVKTDGFATLTGRSDVNRNAFPYVTATHTGKGNADFTGLATGTNILNSALSLDEYVECGQYYSIFVTPAMFWGTPNAAADATHVALTPPYSYQEAATVRIVVRIDASIPKVAQGVPSGRGVFSLVPFAPQAIVGVQTAGTTAVPQAFDATGSAFTLQQGVSITTSLTMSTAGLNRAAEFVDSSAAARSALITAQTTANSLGDNAEVAVNAGSYTYTFTPQTTTPQACKNVIPTSSSPITIVDGKHTDLFVLNTYGCLANSNNAQLLRVVTAVRSSATETGHSPWTAATSTRSSESTIVPLYNGAMESARSSMFLLTLVAIVFCLFF